MVSENARHRVLCFLVLGLAGFFLFSNLTDRYLWKDEAETALLARSVLKGGVPKAVDGQNRIHLHIRDSLRGDNVWTFHPWLSIYTTALSFAFLGESTFAARLPAVLFGLLSLMMTYLLALRLSRNRNIALLSMLIVTFSVPFLLHMREARYYAPTIFFALLFLWSYLQWIEKEKGGGLTYFLSGNLLFHSNYGVFLPILFSVMLHYVIRNRTWVSLKPFLLMHAALFVTTFPWFVYLKGFQHLAEWNSKRVSHNLQFYFRVTYKFIFPLFFFLIAALVYGVRKKGTVLFSQFKSLPKGYVQLLLIVIGVSMAFGLTGQQKFFRYILHLVPIYAFLMAVIFYSWMRYSKPVALFFLAVVLTTNVLHYSLPIFAVKHVIGKDLALKTGIIKPKKLNHYVKNTVISPLHEYLYEITHPFKDMTKGIVTFVKENAKAGETIGIPYSDHPLMFYTDFKVVNLMYDYSVLTDWIIFQADWFGNTYGPCEDNEFCRKIMANYDRTELDIPDLNFGNRPGPYAHRFRSATDRPNLVVYKKRLN